MVTVTSLSKTALKLPLTKQPEIKILFKIIVMDTLGHNTEYLERYFHKIDTLFMEKLIWKNLLEKRAKWLFFGKKIANFEILKIFENLIDRAGAPLGQGTNRQIDRLVIERIIQDMSFGSVHIYWSINPNVPMYP